LIFEFDFKWGYISQSRIGCVFQISIVNVKTLYIHLKDNIILKVIILNRKLIILGLISLVLFSISAVSAADNLTESEILSDGEEYNAELINVEDFTTHYSSDESQYFDVVSYDSYYVDARFDIVDNKTGKYIGAARYIDGEGYISMECDVGNYNATIKPWKYQDYPYDFKPVTFNVKITKAPVKLTANKWISTTKQYATLKVLVKDEYDSPVKEGTVKFTVNGKNYNVKVKNGVATKKVKLTKAKTYTYKAVFSSKNYKTKTVSSKVYVKKAKKKYTFKIGKYQCKMVYSKYSKLLAAKNNKKFKEFSFVAGKKYGKYPIHIYVGTSAKDMLYPKGDYVHIWIDDGRGMDGYIKHKKINLYTLNP